MVKKSSKLPTFNEFSSNDLPDRFYKLKFFQKYIAVVSCILIVCMCLRFWLQDPPKKHRDSIHNTQEQNSKSPDVTQHSNNSLKINSLSQGQQNSAAETSSDQQQQNSNPKLNGPAINSSLELEKNQQILNPKKLNTENTNSLDQNSLAKSINNQSEKISAQLPVNENIFFSPMSIDIALAMLFEGTSEKLKDILSEKLGFISDNDDRLFEINEFMRFYNLKREFKTSRRRNSAYRNEYNPRDDEDKSEPFTQILNNGLFISEQFTVKPSYIESLHFKFHSMTKRQNFLDNPKAFEEINKWVAQATNNKIKDLLQELDPSTILVLINTIYFKANWFHEFKKNDTYKGDFKTLNLKSGITPFNKKVDMMVSNSKRYPYMTDLEGNLFIEIQYKTTSAYDEKNKPIVSMVIMLPNKQGSTDFGLNYTNEIADLVSMPQDQKNKLESVELHMPKFEIKNKINLNEILIKLGLKSIFNPPDRGFDNISVSKNIAVSDVIHQSFIKVDEDGTEAAAATAIIMLKMAIMHEKIHKKIHIDRPFGFWIVEKNTKTVLFTGKVVDPSE